MPNWDDEFDFDDIESDNKKVKAAQKSKPTKLNDDDQFFDLDSIKPKKKQPESTLPVINPRNSAHIKPSAQQKPTKSNPYANKQLGSKQIQNNSYDQYFQQDIAEEVQEKPKPPAKTLQKPTNNKQVLANKSNLTSSYNQQLYEEQVPDQSPQKKTSSKQKLNQQYGSKKQVEKVVNKVQALISVKSINNISKVSVAKNHKPQDQQQDYGQQFDDEYANDEFQSESKIIQPAAKSKNNEIIKPKPQVKVNNLAMNRQSISEKSQNKPSKQNQAPVQRAVIPPPKPPVTNEKRNSKNTIVSNRNINKIESKSVNKPLARNNSQSSIRSNNQQSLKGSRVSYKNESNYFPNKHTQMVNTSFPQSEQKLNILSPPQINKINQKMRAMIRRFNEQLNDLINKNMLLLKNKAGEKTINVQQRIKQLQIQKKSGQTAIEVMEKDFDRLHGRHGELKEEEYQLILQKKIEEKKNEIKDTLKDITSIKRQVDTKGKKLSFTQDQQKNANSIHHIKTIFIQLKKDQQKGDERIQSLTTSHQQLETKLSDLEYKLDELISQAKQKGVNIENSENLVKKHQDKKNKLQQIKGFNKKSEGLFSTKIDILNHENQQIRIVIRNVNSQINNLYGSIDHSQNESIKLIEKAQEKANINPLFAQSLQKLLKQLQQSKANNDYFEARSQVKSRKSNSSRNKSKHDSPQDKIQNSLPLKVNQNQNKMNENDQNISKPKFMKKKPTDEPKFILEAEKKINQRIWDKEDEQNAKAVKHNQNVLSIDIGKIKDKTQTVIQPVDEVKDKSKPFMLRKNKNEQKEPVKEVNNSQDMNTPKNQTVHKEIIQKEIIPETKKQQKEQQGISINIAPRMIRFGKKKQQSAGSTKQIGLSLEGDKLAPKAQPNQFKPINKQPIQHNPDIQIQPHPTIQQQKPIFVPKRFNLRNKSERKDDSYTPSVQNISVQKQVPTVKESIKEEKQQYKPKFDFRNQKQQTKEQLQHIKQQPKSIQIEQPEIKPKFNLRLRDKMKKNPDQDNAYGYGSSKNINDAEKNQGVNNIIGIDAKQVQKQSHNNPYQSKVQQSSNPYAPSNNKQQNLKPISISNEKTNPYAPKQQPQMNSKVLTTNNNPPAQIISSNPYAQNATLNNETQRREKGPLKKNKISSNIQKQSFNIYEQAEDITQDVPGDKTVLQAEIGHKQSINLGNKKQTDLNLNQMLGIKKKAVNDDFNDLLGNVGTVGTKNKKKNNDFFDDLDL